MPSIRSLSCADDLIRFIDRNGTRDIAGISVNGLTVPQAQAFVDNFIAANITDFQVRVQVFSLNPLRATVAIFDLGITIPVNWRR